MQNMLSPIQFSEILIRLERLYGPCAQAIGEQIRSQIDALDQESPALNSADETTPLWTEKDVVLITYADQLHQTGQSPLDTLGQFLLEEQWGRLLKTVHLLPFYPSSSDDGFSVIDYMAVDPRVGDWSSVQKLGQHFGLMFDLVLNHISQQSAWFQKYLQGESPFDRFFLEMDPATDLSAVVRPRSSPLLTPFDTHRGKRHVWTTFSADQIDLNFAEPEVLVRMVEVLLEYVRRGARIIRLDAVAFLWKEIGTCSLHLPKTHEVVKLFHDLLAAVAPHVLLLTETNVPHEENVRYFGQGEEAQMVYQFSLPPLLLEAFMSGDASLLTNWLSDLADPPAGTTYFNFTASHDGIGVRPLEGLVSEDRLKRLIAGVERRGGLVSRRRQPDGSETPYEMNISYVDALAPEPTDAPTTLHAQRFLATQAVMLGLRGMPAIYFHSLVGTQNDSESAARSGQPRRINRRKFSREELGHAISAPDSLQQKIYTGYRHLVSQRIGQAAFHPDAPQKVIHTNNRALLLFERTSLDGSERVLVGVNVSDSLQSVQLRDKVDRWNDYRHDLIQDVPLKESDRLVLEPGQAVWLCTGEPPCVALQHG